MAEPVQQEFDFAPEFLGTTSLKTQETSFGVTVDDKRYILEFIKVAKAGTFIRNNGTWESLDPDEGEESNETVFNQSWHDVAATFLLFYDHYVTKKDAISLDEITDFLVL